MDLLPLLSLSLHLSLALPVAITLNFNIWTEHFRKCSPTFLWILKIYDKDTYASFIQRSDIREYELDYNCNSSSSVALERLNCDCCHCYFTNVNTMHFWVFHTCLQLFFFSIAFGRCTSCVACWSNFGPSISKGYGYQIMGENKATEAEIDIKCTGIRGNRDSDAFHKIASVCVCVCIAEWIGLLMPFESLSFRAVIVWPIFFHCNCSIFYAKVLPNEFFNAKCLWFLFMQTIWTND